MNSTVPRPANCLPLHVRHLVVVLGELLAETGRGEPSSLLKNFFQFTSL